MAEIFGHENGDLRIESSGSGVSIALNMKTSTKETQELLEKLNVETQIGEESPRNSAHGENSFECDLRTLAGSYLQSQHLSVYATV